MIRDEGTSFDLPLLAAVLSLLAVGLVAVFSASSVPGLLERGDAAYYFKRQLHLVVADTAPMTFLSKFDCHRLRLVPPRLLLVSVPCLVMVLVACQQISRPRRWIDLGFFNFQPSEPF